MKSNAKPCNRTPLKILRFSIKLKISTYFEQFSTDNLNNDEGHKLEKEKFQDQANGFW